jgi:hypothetical protein
MRYESVHVRIRRKWAQEKMAYAHLPE